MRDESVLRDETVDCAVEAVDLVDISVGGVATEAAVLKGGLEGCLGGGFLLEYKAEDCGVLLEAMEGDSRCLC
jgi:hypothetical protein